MEEDPQTEKRKNNMWIGIGVGVGGLILVLFLWWLWHRRTHADTSPNAINLEMTRRILKNPNTSAEIRDLLTQ